MKHIVKFSLDRRFKNKVTLVLHILMISVLSCVVFMDKIIEVLFVDANEKTVVFYDKKYKNIYSEVDDQFFDLKEGKEEEGINIFFEDNWVIESTYNLDPVTSINLQSMMNSAISNAWFSTISEESAYTIVNNISPEITERTTNKSPVGRDKMNMSMFLITGIYFAMLSFSTMIANEVVYEKTSRVLEIILTSVSTSTHYFSKMIVAWMTVMVQMFAVVTEIVIIVGLRNLYDEGSGILKILSQYNFLEVEATTFKGLITALGIDSKLVMILSVSLIYMLLGIVIVQMIMVTLSSFIKSIEESGAIQAPVYIVFLIVYYIALALNTPAKLNDGIGYYLSLSPIVSMLFMPMRLLLVEVTVYEIMLGIILNVCTLIIFSYYGSKLYHYGILGGFNFRKRKKST